MTTHASTLAVVPVLIGPAQVLIALVPAILLAIAGRVIARLHPRALRSTAVLLWKKKIAVVVFVLCCASTVWAWRRVFPPTQRGAGSAERGQNDWTIFRGGPERRGIAGDVASIKDATGGVINWTFADGDFDTFFASPAVAGNAIYITASSKGVYTDRGAVFCLDARTGAMIWKFAPADYRATYASPVVSGKYVVVGEGLHYTPDARILCLDADTGKKIWEVRTKSKVESTPTIYDGKAYVGASEDGLYCIALEPKSDGTPNVVFHLSGKDYQDCDASPVVYKDRVYWPLGVGGNAVACTDAQTGRHLWRTDGRFPVFSSPTVAGGKIIVGMGNGNLIETADMVRDRTLDEMRRKGATEAELAAARERLAPGGAVWALDPETGRKIWEIPLTQTTLGEVAAADGKLYFGCQDGLVRVADLDGHILQTWNARDPIPTSPAVGKDHVYFVTDSGQLVGLDRGSLEPKWSISVGNQGPFLSSPVLADGKIYVGTSGNGFVCAGEPRGDHDEAIWPAAQGPAGKGGWIDGSALPAQARIAWQYPFPKESADDAPAPVATRMTAPPMAHQGAIYAAVASSERIGIAKILPTSATRKEPAEAWFFKTETPITISPVASGNTICISDGQQVTALDEATGAVAWTHAISAGASGEMLMMKDRLIVVDQPSALTAIGVKGADAGKVLWSRPKTSVIGAPTAIGDIVVTFTKETNGFLAVDAIRGATLWSTFTDEERAGPVPLQLHDGTWAAVVGERGWTHVVTVFTNPKNDEDAASLSLTICSTGGEPASPVVVSGQRFAYTTSDGQLVVGIARDPGPNELVRLTDALPGVAPLLAGDRMLYATKTALKLVELDAPTRPAKVWLKTDWLGGVTTAPILVDGRVYFGTANKGLICAGARN